MNTFHKGDSVRRTRKDFFVTNPIGVSRKQFEKFIHTRKPLSRQEMLKTLEFECFNFEIAPELDLGVEKNHLDI